MEFAYYTIDKAVEDVLYKEKGSKFIGFAYPVYDEDEVKNRLNHIKELHPKATHHCYAWKIGDGDHYRANDDGEPSGSAGLPIYNQILAKDITNVLVIVVRYYGGTKLGVSGLIKAYKTSAKMTLEDAKIIKKEEETTLMIHFPYDQQNKVFTVLNKNNVEILDFDTQEACTIRANIPLSKKENISENFSEMLTISLEWEK